MKKQIRLLCVLLCLLFLPACAPPEETVLSEEEIKALREEYPFPTGEMPYHLYERMPLTYEDVLPYAVDVVYVEVRSERMFYSYSRSEKGPPRYEGAELPERLGGRYPIFIQNVLVLDSAKGEVKAGDVIPLIYEGVMAECTPDYPYGQRLVMPIRKHENERLSFVGEYFTNREITYYVTESEHLISVLDLSDKIGTDYTGWKVSVFMNEMRNNTIVNTRNEKSEQ